MVSRAQNRRREIGVVRRIREVLCLEAHRAPSSVDVPVLADGAAIQLVARIELQPRLGRGDVERAARHGILEPGGVARRCAISAAAQHEIVVVPIAASDLLVIRVDARANLGRLPKIERRSRHGPDLAGGDLGIVGRRVLIGVDRQMMPENVAVPFAGKVEVAVLRQVDGRGVIRRCGVIDDQLVARSQGIRHAGVDGARIAFFAVSADVVERHARLLAAAERHARPQNFVEARAPAVQMMPSVVRGQKVARAVEREPRVRDAVRASADHGAEVAGPRQVAVERIEPEYDIVHAPVAIGRAQRRNDRSVADEPDLELMRIGQRVHVDLSAAGQCPEDRPAVVHHADPNLEIRESALTLPDEVLVS